MSAPLKELEATLTKVSEQLRPRLAAMLGRSPTTEGFGKLSVVIEVKAGRPVITEVIEANSFRAT